MPTETFTGVRVLSFRKLPFRPVYRLRLQDGQRQFTAEFQGDHITESTLEFLRGLKSHTVTLTFEDGRLSKAFLPLNQPNTGLDLATSRHWLQRR